MNKKRIIIISSIILIILIIIIGIFIMIYNNKTITKEYENTLDRLDDALTYLKNIDIKDEGELLITAKYKGAHGEHYPRESTYYFRTNYLDNDYTVLIGNDEGYVRKKYNNSLNNIYERLKTSELKLDDNYEDNLKSFFNNILDEDYRSCSIKVNTEGLIKEVESTEIKCDNLYLIFKDKNIKIEYKDNNISIDTFDKGYTLNINNELRMNAFLEENVNKYSIVIGEDVFYVEITDELLTLSASSAKAIYNALDFTVKYQDVEIKEEKEISEIEIPLFRYFNEYDFTYWRD